MENQENQMAGMQRITLYNDQKANNTNIWLLFLFFGWSYGSLGSIGKQLAFYFTLGGLGIWSIVRLFTLSSAIKEYNKNLAGRLQLTNEEKMQVGLYL